MAKNIHKKESLHFPQWMIVLEAIWREKILYTAEIVKKYELTYSHVHNIMQKLENKDLLMFKKEGRIRVISLTKQGIEMSEAINKIKNML